MSVTEILTTAGDYLLGTGSDLSMEEAIPEMIAQLAKAVPVFGQVGVIYNYDASPETPQRFFPLPESILQLLSVHFFPRELEPAGVSWAQDALDPGWRRRTGMPIRYTQEIETTQQVRLYPAPTMAGLAGIPPFQGIPGAMVPTNHLVTFFLEAPAVVDLSPWFEDLVSYLLVSWEASREGERQDMAMAQAMLQLTALIVALLKELYHHPGEELLETAWKVPLIESFT